MKFDKNTVIGFALLAVLFFGYFFYINKGQQAQLQAEKARKDSIARIQALHKDTTIVKTDSAHIDSLHHIMSAGNFNNAANGKEQLLTLENDVIKVTLTNKGGQIKQVELKKYRKANGTPVILMNEKNDHFSYAINTGNNQSTETNDLFFTPSNIVKNADGSQSISFSIMSADSNSIIHQFSIKPNDYMIDLGIQLNGANRLLTQRSMNIDWAYTVQQQEQDMTYEKTQSRLYYFENDNYDYSSIALSTNKKIDNSIKALAIKQRFFNTTLISNNTFNNVEVHTITPPDSTHQISNTSSTLHIQVPASNNVSIPMQWYVGPNDYKILKQYQLGLESMIDLGSGIFSFVKYLNRWVILPVFNFFAQYISNLGWVILLLTICIRLLISPLTYSSYLSGAKMKVLRPELDELKKKHGNNQQAYAMDQMKLFREAGVNPLGGCIPSLLQIPIFFALYNFFNSNIALRGQSFLWAKDLSSYDVIFHLPFSIPLGYGDHVSLFTLTAIATSLLISVYNMSMTPTQGNPMMKYMPYIFPVILLFVFNRLPSALTWYYTVSNSITLILQLIIQKYIIDHDRILAKMDMNRKKPKTKSKLQERLEQMQETQKKIQALKQKKN